MFKKIIIALSLVLILASCGAKNTNIEMKKHNLTEISWEQMKDNIKKLDSEGKKIVIEYFSSNDEKKKAQLKEQIIKHMKDIQSEIWDIKWDTIQEKNMEIQKITKKLKLYKSLGF